MKRFATAVVSAAAGLGAVLGLHGSRSPAGSSHADAPNHSHHTTATKHASSSNGKARTTLRDGVEVGTAYQYGYGILSVRVATRTGRIISLSTVGLRTAEPYSQSIAQQAIPILRNEVLSAQSANVATVSGATYTSEAYLYSIQSALDKLRS